MLVTVFVSPKEALFFQEKVLLVARPPLTAFIPRVVSLYRHESPRGHQSWELMPAVPLVAPFCPLVCWCHLPHPLTRGPGWGARKGLRLAGGGLCGLPSGSITAVSPEQSFLLSDLDSLALWREQLQHQVLRKVKGHLRDF